MKRRIRRSIERRQRQATRRTELASKPRWDSGRPTLPATGATYEISDRVSAVAQGGIGAVQRVIARVGVAHEIDRRVQVLKVHRPYHESDHVLNVAFNVLCGGRTLDDIEVRRNDPVYLDALGVEMTP